MRNILISIKPEWVEKILNGEKIIEIRKSIPKCELPCKVYIYCTKGNKELRLFNQKVCASLKIPRAKTYSKAQQKAYTKFIGDESQSLNGKVVAEFTLNKVEEFKVFENGSVQYWNCFSLEKSCLKYDDIALYIGCDKTGYAWYIDDLKIYDKPKELSEFSSIIKRMKGKESRFTSHLLQRPPQSWCYVEGE